MAADLDEVMRSLPSRHGDLAALITRLFGPTAQERVAGAEPSGRPATAPELTAPRFALELARPAPAASCRRSDRTTSPRRFRWGTSHRCHRAVAEAAERASRRRQR